ncbi:MAG: hypothetical protein KKF20_05230 [Bacteroidetes bacterium]|nr:hypothetical protein [Bacteroidota bacterium]MBU1421755.1 hypothetical protein [Bacteroidota bacterium]MBU2471791.1 hypothetical protein [Bacteroidota bacterium]MBU2637183.1 hypothetical protein [Bacteroidota bacterium]
MYVVKYSGPFGFIKPWTAVRDNETYSQNFLTPSIVEGIEKKLFPELLEQKKYESRIVRHRLTYTSLSKQQEQTQPRAIDITVKKKEGFVVMNRPRSILTRGVMVNPILYLAFSKLDYAERAVQQHICLCRNEDVLLPQSFVQGELIFPIEEDDFDKPENGFNGFELRFGKNKQSFIVGFNRFDKSKPMYGWLHIVGNNPMTTREI